MFDFFGLSRELRDQIYDNSLSKNIRISSKTRLRVRVRNGPSRCLMLVSRKFSIEYLEAMARCTAIVCVDNGHELPMTLQAPKLPAGLRAVRHLELRLWLVCDNKQPHTPVNKACSVPTELSFHLSWIGQITGQMHAPVVNILLGLEEGNARDCEAEFLDRYVNLVGVRGFHDLVVRRGRLQYKMKRETAPRVISRYNEKTHKLELLDLAASEPSKTGVDFGYAEEEDEVAR